MDRLDAMRMAVAIADRGSLTAAASVLDVSPATVVRGLAALETSLRVRLFHRTTRRVTLTEEGRDHVERCRRIVAEIDEAEASLAARQQRPAGVLRVTAPVMFGRLHVAPLVAELLEREPDLRVELLLVDRVVDLVEEGLDLAVRIGRLPDSSLAVTPLGSVDVVACASPPYLERRGTPRRPDDLRRHACIRFLGLDPAPEWRFGSGGRTVRVPVEGPLVTNQVDVALDACTRGLGLARFLSYQVAQPLARGTLRRVLAGHEPPARAVQLVRPPSRFVPSRVRAFLDLATPRLREQLAAKAATRR